MVQLYSVRVVRTFSTFVLIALVCSCANDNLIDVIETAGIDSRDYYIWTPKIEIRKGNNQATLFMADPRPFTSYDTPGPGNPDYFKIWISDAGADDFIYYGKVHFSTTSLLIDHLTNGKPYYFFVASHRGNQAPVHSDTVMTVPSEQVNPQPFFNNIELSIKRVSASSDLKYFTYAYNDVLYLRDASGSSSQVANAPYDYAHWSPTSNKFIYVTSKDEGIYRYPDQLKLFEADTKRESILFEVDYHNYDFLSPAFTPDGNKLSFLSSEGNSAKHQYDFWIFDPVSKSRTRISDFEQAEFFPYGSYDWSPLGGEIYLTGRYEGEYDNNIYKYTLSTNSLTPVIESRWYETSPSVSPDNHRIAFISDRTGHDELWVYDLITLEYSQVTGLHHRLTSPYSNLEWLTNEHMLITLSEDETSVAVVVNVN